MKLGWTIAGLMLLAEAAIAQDSDKTSLTTENPRFDVQPITLGTSGTAILIDHVTGRTWILNSATDQLGVTFYKWIAIMPSLSKP